MVSRKIKPPCGAAAIRPPLMQRCILLASIRRSIFVLLGITGLAASPAYSQSDNSQSSTSETDQSLQEVVVTAERRESTVQKTPFSITAISGPQLQARGIESLEDLATETAGIEVRSAGPGQTEYDMRGLTSSGGSSATTGFYLNDVPLASPAQPFTGHVAIDPDLFDLNRVEVLRGPQGTLYGAGSMGGTVRLVTNEPVMNKFEAAAQGTISGTSGGGPNYGGSVMVNIPLVDDRLALRIVGTDKYNDGWIDRIVEQPFPIGPTGACGYQTCTRGNVLAGPVVASDPRSNWERLTGGRASLLFQATDDLSVELMGMYQSISMGAFSEVDDPPGVDLLNHYQPFNDPEPFEDTFRVAVADVNYDMKFAKLTSTTSYWNRDSVWSSDVSENWQNFNATVFGFTPFINAPYYNDDPSHQSSEELRLTSEGDGEFQWVVGGFYSNFGSAFIQYIANPAYGAISTGGPAANPLGILYQANEPYYMKQYAAFAETSYQILDSLKATVGIRWYRFNSEQDGKQAGVVTISGNATPSYATVEANQSGANPKVNLSYAPNRNLTVYAQAAKGFRPGGVNVPVSPACTVQPSPSYAPDSLWDFEGGEKARFLDGRVVVNADYYYIIWNKVQEELDQVCGYPFTTNAGTAVSYGPEFELNADVTPELSFSLSGTYTQAYLRSVAAGEAGTTIGATTTLTPGLRLDNVPHYTVNTSASYSVPVSDRYKLLGRITASVIGPQYDISYYTQKLGGYTLLNARVGLLGGALVPYLFVDNLTNRHAVVTINTQEWAIGNPSFDRDAITTPRTFGLDLQYKFH
jgi:iron complex outermembrane receptor protein